MQYNISKPSPYLSQYVKQYWSLDSNVVTGESHIQRIVPSGLFELIFYLNDKPEASDHKKSITENVIITGQLKTHHDLKIVGRLSLFAIYFLPQGLSMFLNLPIKALFNQSVPLKDVMKEVVNQLEDELYAAPTFKGQIAVAEKFLIKRLQQKEREYKYDRIRYVVNEINKTKGLVEINELAEQTFLSRKQFERTFSDIIGSSPKQFQKIVRFQNAIHIKSKNKNLSLTEIAHQCGYFDQSHMINDFKSLSGMSPKQFFTNEEPFSDYFN